MGEHRRRRRHVAVVGTGMAGLTTAYLLHHDPQQRFQVRLIDKVLLRTDIHFNCQSLTVE